MEQADRAGMGMVQSIAHCVLRETTGMPACMFWYAVSVKR